MIDIHTHILPYVDDGAEDMEDALLMAELAVESGVDTVIATPHCNIPGVADNYVSPRMDRFFSEFREQIDKRGIPLTLLSGMEIYATEDVCQKLQEGRLRSLNDSGRYLVEFGFQKRGAQVTKILEDLCNMGAKPIVAHPERYACIQKNPGLARDWIDMGCQLQMNKGSIFGKFGRASFYAAEALLNSEWITYIASDAHSPYRRTTYMRDIYVFLCEEFSMDAAQRLLKENPQRYLIDKAD